MSKEITVQSELLKCFTEQGISEKEAGALLKAASDITERIQSWDALADINITSIEQVQEMKTADKNRLAIKNDRLVVEKFTDSKRETVQEKMSSYKKEDTAWLRVKQYTEKKAKELEDKLKLAAEFKERYEKEQREKLKAQQLEQLKAVCDQAESFPLPMEETAFGKLLEDMTLARKQREIQEKAAEKQRIADEKAEALRLEREKKQAETQKTRLNELLPYSAFVPEKTDMTALWDLEDKAYQKLLKDVAKACEDKKLADEEAEKVKNSYLTKINNRIAELVSYELKFDFKSTYTGFGFFIDILYIKTYDDEKWTQLIDKLKETVDNHKVTLGSRIEELVSFGTPVSEAMALITLSTTEEEYNELLEEIKKEPEIKIDSELVYRDTAGQISESVNSLEKETVEPEQTGSPTPFSNTLLTGWVNGFKIDSLHEEDLTEPQKLIYQDIFAKFNGFVSWSKKQIPE